MVFLSLSICSSLTAVAAGLASALLFLVFAKTDTAAVLASALLPLVFAITAAAAAVLAFTALLPVRACPLHGWPRLLRSQLGCGAWGGWCCSSRLADLRPSAGAPDLDVGLDIQFRLLVRVARRGTGWCCSRRIACRRRSAGAPDVDVGLDIEFRLLVRVARRGTG